MPGWLRISTILIGAVIGFGGAELGYSMALVISAAIVFALIIEGLYRLAQRKDGRNA